MAVSLTLKAFQSELQGHHNKLRLDNSLVVAYINKQGGILLSLALEVLGWAERNALSPSKRREIHSCRLS